MASQSAAGKTQHIDTPAGSALAHVAGTLLEPCHVLCIDQAVSKHPMSLMQPQQSELTGLCGGLGVGPHDPLDDPSHIPQVERVVGLGGGG